MTSVDHLVDFKTRTMRRFHGQGHSASTILTSFAENFPLIHADCYNARRQKRPFNPKKGERSMHTTTMSLKEPAALDYTTTVNREFGGSKTLPPSRRPPVCRSMHIPQFEYAHYGTPKIFQNTTHHRQTYCNKKTEPAATMHFPTFLNKVHMNQGTNMKTSIHADSTTNYNSQYNRIHNKLGSALGPGVKRSYPERKSYNIITGRDEEVAWANDVDWRQISGNRVLSAARQVTWSPITGEPLVY